MSPKNRAAYIPSAHGRLEVRDAPYPTPGEHEMVVQVGYVAINPVEWKVQQYDFLIQQYPHILGSDVAGKVVEVGKGVDEKKFAKGQRVISSVLDHLSNVLSWIQRTSMLTDGTDMLAVWVRSSLRTVVFSSSSGSWTG